MAQADDFVEFVKTAGCVLQPHQETILRRMFDDNYVMAHRSATNRQINRATKAIRRAAKQIEGKIPRRQKIRIMYDAMVDE